MRDWYCNPFIFKVIIIIVIVIIIIACHYYRLFFYVQPYHWRGLWNIPSYRYVSLYCTLLLYFQVQRDNAYSSSIFFILGSIYRYPIHLQKAARRFLGFRFWKAGKQVLSAQPDQFEPFLLLLWAFLCQPAFKFSASRAPLRWLWIINDVPPFCAMK